MAKIGIAQISTREYRPRALSMCEVCLIEICICKIGFCYTPSGVMDLSSAMDDLIIGIMSEISQYDNSIRAERSRLGKLNKIRQGFWMGGPPPFGYKIEDRKLVENPDESQWIKKIYQWYVKGKRACVGA